MTTQADLEQWRELATDIFRSMAEYGSFEELHDYSSTLTQELRDNGAEALSQLDGWFSALGAVRKRAWEGEKREQEERLEAEQRAVGERLRTLGSGPRPAPEQQPTVVRYPRDLDGPVSYDAAAVLPRPHTAPAEADPDPLPPAETQPDPHAQLPLDPRAHRRRGTGQRAAAVWPRARGSRTGARTGTGRAR